ncbi:ABC transporter ATP-binding protein [Companilactobacillus sp. DQM5]|uniref:ABC transporter ATP-binding protein n=1 Tax=Companilactobacillus sp. DQM5 TaxID=3463359 RepID=UPI00405895D5
MHAIEIKNISKKISSNQILNGINLNINQGEIFTLLGENGAGKTTLINILTTLSLPTSGTINIMGNDLNNSEEIRKLISLNAQTNTIDDNFTGYENLKLIAELRNISTDEITILSKKLNLESFIKRKVKTYSGGMKRRLDIAMSLIGNPKIIFLDEPTTGIDPKNRIEIWNIIKELKNSGKTIFLTTQYLEEADHLSDYIGIINNGKIVLYGTPEEIKNETESLFSIEITKKDVLKSITLLNEANISFKQNNSILIIPENDIQKTLKILVENKIFFLDFHKIKLSLENVFLKTIQRR